MGKPLNPNYMKEYYIRNKEKANQVSKEYYQANRERLLQMQKGWARQRLYGLSQEDYDAMLLKTNGNCQMCGYKFLKTPHIDHCHVTGKVRGLLCAECNTSLGIY
jgi:hypothetical protein